MGCSYSFIRCVSALWVAMFLALLTSACQPHVIVATQAEHQSFTRLLEQEQAQLEQINQLGTRLEGMHNALLDDQNEAVYSLRRRVDEQSGELRQLRRELDSLRQDLKEQAQKRMSSPLYTGCVRQSGSSAPASDSRGKQVVGAEERIFLAPPGKIFPARIDTGATTSSIDARNIEPFERDGEAWVRFTLSDPESGEGIEVERKVVRNVRIIQALTENREKRQVVEFQITLGNTTRSAEFTLSDRSHMEFPVLVGRNILKDSMSVDVSKKYISTPLSAQDQNTNGH